MPPAGAEATAAVVRKLGLTGVRIAIVEGDDILDRLKFIELLPGNRIRLLVSRAFAWIPDGPIQRLFKSQLSQDFLKSNPGSAIVYDLRSSHVVRVSLSGARILASTQSV